jgi:hypothetical protein
LVFESFELIFKILDEGLFFVEFILDIHEFSVMLEADLSEFSIKFIGFGKGFVALFL